MSTPVTFVGNVYNIPAYQDTGYAQGTGNLSSYLISLATGSLTLSGGTFTLTADADFGANFGLKSIYYKSRAANVSATGVIRLGSAEIIGWRDNGNTADLELTTNASDQLTYNGLVIATSTGALVGTTLTLSATSNQMVIGTTRTVTLTLPTPAGSSRTVTVPDLSANYSVVGTEGTQTINGEKTFTANLFVADAAASDLYIKIHHNNATGDPFVWFLTNTVNWACGVDNSASDAFVISASATPGTTNVMSISTTGVVTLSNDLAIPATELFFLDGGGDTYITESAANIARIYTGGTIGLQISATSIQIPATSQFFLDGGGNTYLQESSADVLISVVGGTTILTQTSSDVYTTTFTDYSETSTVTGWTSFTAKKIFYKKIGKLTYVSFEITGTSNATGASFTLPTNNNASIGMQVIMYARDNTGTSVAGTVFMDPSTATVVGAPTVGGSSSGWTNSGTKSIIGQFVYQTA